MPDLPLKHFDPKNPYATAQTQKRMINQKSSNLVIDTDEKEE
jgi:hypothetical protein